MDPTKSPDAAPSGTELDIGRYVAVLRKHLWVLLATMAIGVTLTVIYTMRQPRIYRATASIVIDPQPPQVFGSQFQDVIQLGAGSYWSNQEYYNTQVDIITSYDLAKLTVSRDGLYNKLAPLSEQEPRSDEERLEAAATILDDALDATQNRESRIVNISVRHTDPDLAAELANEHVKTYIAYTKGLRSSGSTDISKYLAEELDRAESRLRESEQALYEFKKEADILSVSLEDKQNILAADIGRFNAALSDARIKRIELAALKKRAEGLRGDELLESPVFALATNSGSIEPLKTQYLQEKQKFLDLSEALGPRHPDYQKQQKKIDELYAAIEKEARRAMRELDERHAAAIATEQQFQAELERLKKEAFELGPKSIAYNRLQRQQQSDEENFKLVLGRLRTSELSGRNEQVNIRPHQSARGAVLVHPRMRLNVALATVLCVLLGVALSFGLEYMDRTVKSAEDVEATAGAPVLGLIPVLQDVALDDSAQALRQRDLYVFTHPKSRAAEFCRSIRTNLLFSSADRALNVITVSSANPREGKTTSAIYLGTTMAQSGQRVLIVDTDMRRPRLHKSMGVPRGRGLSNLILGDASYEDAIKTSEIPNLFVLPCGPTPPNPAELLLTNRFRQIIDELRGRYDLVILDSPPLQAVTDAVILGRLSDGVILVVQGGKTLRDEVTRSMRQLRDVDTHVVGVILNDLDVSGRKYGYGYYYHYGYGETSPEGSSEAA